MERYENDHGTVYSSELTILKKDEGLSLEVQSFSSYNKIGRKLSHISTAQSDCRSEVSLDNPHDRYAIIRAESDSTALVTERERYKVNIADPAVSMRSSELGDNHMENDSSRHSVNYEDRITTERKDCDPALDGDWSLFNLDNQIRTIIEEESNENPYTSGGRKHRDDSQRQCADVDDMCLSYSSNFSVESDETDMVRIARRDIARRIPVHEKKGSFKLKRLGPPKIVNSDSSLDSGSESHDTNIQSSFQSDSYVQTSDSLKSTDAILRKSRRKYHVSRSALVEILAKLDKTSKENDGSFVSDNHSNEEDNITIETSSDDVASEQFSVYQKEGIGRWQKSIYSPQYNGATRRGSLGRSKTSPKLQRHAQSQGCLRSKEAYKQDVEHSLICDNEESSFNKEIGEKAQVITVSSDRDIVEVVASTTLDDVDYGCFTMPILLEKIKRPEVPPSQENYKEDDTDIPMNTSDDYVKKLPQASASINVNNEISDVHKAPLQQGVNKRANVKKPPHTAPVAKNIGTDTPEKIRTPSEKENYAFFFVSSPIVREANAKKSTGKNNLLEQERSESNPADKNESPTLLCHVKNPFNETMQNKYDLAQDNSYTETLPMDDLSADTSNRDSINEVESGSTVTIQNISRFVSCGISDIDNKEKQSSIKYVTAGNMRDICIPKCESNLGLWTNAILTNGNSSLMYAESSSIEKAKSKEWDNNLYPKSIGNKVQYANGGLEMNGNLSTGNDFNRDSLIISSQANTIQNEHGEDFHNFNRLQDQYGGMIRKPQGPLNNYLTNESSKNIAKITPCDDTDSIHTMSSLKSSEGVEMSLEDSRVKYASVQTPRRKSYGQFARSNPLMILFKPKMPKSLQNIGSNHPYKVRGKKKSDQMQLAKKESGAFLPVLTREGGQTSGNDGTKGNIIHKFLHKSMRRKRKKKHHNIATKNAYPASLPVPIFIEVGSDGYEL